MGTNKSILALSVIEIVPHECKFDECQEQFPLKDIDEHEKVCRHRIVACPNFNLCDEKVPLSKLIEHLCEGDGSKKCSRNAAPKSLVGASGLWEFKVPNLSSLSDKEIYWKVITYSYTGICFSLRVSKTGNDWHFNIVMFEPPEVCSRFNLVMEVYEQNSSPDSPLSAKIRSKPCSIDEPQHDIEDLGLTISDKLMKKFVLRENSFEFKVSFSFF